MIVSLNEEGSVAVNYLGTDPPTSTVAAAEVKELNYEDMDAEHRELLNVIRQSQGGTCGSLDSLKYQRKVPTN